METTTVSLIIGSLCAGLVWWSVLQFCTFRIRTRHVQAVRKATVEDAEKAAAGTSR